MSCATGIYLDHNATTLLDARVKEAMLPYLDNRFGNPSSVHCHGQRVRYAVDTARQQVARLINAEPEEIVFTSGGTESCNMAILGHCRFSQADAHIVASRIEHPAVLRCVEYVEESKLAKVQWVAVDSLGLLDLLDLEQKLLLQPTLATIMLANNDVGTLQPIYDIVNKVHGASAVFHTDAVQAVGKIPIDVKAWKNDLLSFSAHKFRGPMGVGALYIRRGTRLLPTVFGGHQENRRRPGTENVAAIVGFGAACELAEAELVQNANHVTSLKTKLERGLLGMDGVTIFGKTAPRLPGTCYAGFRGIEGETLQMALDMAGFSVSVGSACSSESRDPSHVLMAMGVDWKVASSAVRFSIGPSNTIDEIDALLQALQRTLVQLRC